MDPKYFGFNPPFLVNGNILPLQVGDRIIKNDLIQLLLTSPGERAFRPTFGTLLPNFLFQLSDDISIEELRNDILNKIELFENRIAVNTVDIRVTDNNTVTVTIVGQISTSANRQLIVELDLPRENIDAETTQTQQRATQAAPRAV